MQHLYHPSAWDAKAPVRSWWEDPLGAPASAYPALGHDIEAEVAIIGGGFTGLSAAYHLAKDHGIQAVVLERAYPGWGASGRNGGFCCMGGTALGWDRIIARYGLKEARAFHRIQADSVALVDDLLRAEAIDADRTGHGGVALAHRASAMPDLQEEAAFMAETFGTKQTLLSRSDLAARGMNGPHFHGGLAEETGFGLNPFKYVTGLARAATERGAKIFSESPVIAWQREGNRHRLTTPRGSVRTGRVLIATNGYTPEDLHPNFGGRLLPILSMIVATRPLTETERAEAGWADTTPSYDLLNLHNYFRLLPDGRFLFGGPAGNSARPSALAHQARALEAAFRRYFPAWQNVEITHRWSGFICLAADRIPHIGAWEDEPGTHYALAYSGSGIAMGTWAGRNVARIMSGNESSGDKPAPVWLRKPPPRFPLPFLRMLYQRYYYLKFALDDRSGK